MQYLDVLVVGGGPVGIVQNCFFAAGCAETDYGVGLVTAYQLAKFGGVKVQIIEKHSKSSQDQYGRAITLYPRSSEMLDQLGLADRLAQECFACRSTVSYDPNGKEVMDRGWAFMENMKDSQWDFALVLRQKYQEEIFRQALKEVGVSLRSPIELTSIEINEEATDSYKITAELLNKESDVKETIMCKYLIGADGGRSFVRRALDIPFDGSTTEDKWVRIDGMIETDMPKPRTYGAIESPTHGNVLWAALDHGATRIGFAFTAERQKAYAEFNEAAAVAEAAASVKPFSLKFNQVDWFTVYSVGQRVARNFFTRGCVFLAGDACHTHSSGAAQGMNTGMHDSVNLAWKLSLVLRGIALPGILETFESERLPNVQKLINYDKDISRLMTMQLPLNWEGPKDADPNEVLGVLMAEAASFTSGLSISLENNRLNIKGSYSSSEDVKTVTAGERAPDFKLTKPGTFEQTRLQKETPNMALFYIVVFAGEPSETSSFLTNFAEALSVSQLFATSSLPISWLTIPAKSGPSAFELLGMQPFGKVFYDEKQAGHQRYGINVKKGGVVVLRPDGWIGTLTTLKADAVEELETYFKEFLVL